MSTLQEMINSMQKQREAITGATRFSPLQELAESIRQQQQSFNLTALIGITGIAKTLSHRMNPVSATSMAILNSMPAQLAAQQITYNKFALSSLTSSLSAIAKTNHLVSEHLSSLASSQLSLSSSMTAIALAMQESHLNRFNSIDIALQGISKAYIKNIALTSNWEAINIAEEANEAITNATDELLNKTSQVTPKDLDDLRTSIIAELSGLLAKTTFEKARQFILNLITVISFLLTLYTISDKTNQDALNETKIEINKIGSELRATINAGFTKLNKMRIATTNVNLRFSAKKNSKIIGLVKLGQQVTVIEIVQKYLLISYIDIETGEPKSGFVVKKYFELKKKSTKKNVEFKALKLKTKGKSFNRDEANER